MASQLERRKKLYHKGFMAGHSQGALDALQMLRTTYDENPDCTVEEVFGAVDQMLLTLSPESTDTAPEENRIVVAPGVRDED